VVCNYFPASPPAGTTPPFYIDTVLGRRQVQLDQPDGGWISTVDRDFIFHWYDLDDLGVRPAQHDRIEYVQNLRPLLADGEPVLYEGEPVLRGTAVLVDVAILGVDRQYNFVDQFRQLVRVHGTELSKSIVDLTHTYPVCTVLYNQEPVMRSNEFVLKLQAPYARAYTSTVHVPEPVLYGGEEILWDGEPVLF
jgi:hypothetical protein